MVLKILAILGHLLTHNVLFQVEEAQKHLFAGSKNFEYMLLCVRHPQNRVGGLILTTRAQKTMFFQTKIVILMPFFGKKWAFFGVGGPESPSF